MNSQNTLHIPVLAPVYAGTSIPDDWQNWSINSFRDIREITGACQQDRFVGVPVVGDSLKSIGIFHGDILITKLTTEYVPEKIGIFQTPNGRTAKFAIENFDGTVTLHNQNGWSQKWQIEDVQLVGVVVRVERDME